MVRKHGDKMAAWYHGSRTRLWVVLLELRQPVTLWANQEAESWAENGTASYISKPVPNNPLAQ